MTLIKNIYIGVAALLAFIASGNPDVGVIVSEHAVSMVIAVLAIGDVELAKRVVKTIFGDSGCHAAEYKSVAENSVDSETGIRVEELKDGAQEEMCRRASQMAWTKEGLGILAHDLSLFGRQFSEQVLDAVKKGGLINIIYEENLSLVRTMFKSHVDENFGLSLVRTVFKNKIPVTGIKGKNGLEIFQALNLPQSYQEWTDKRGRTHLIINDPLNRLSHCIIEQAVVAAKESILAVDLPKFSEPLRAWILGRMAQDPCFRDLIQTGRYLKQIWDSVRSWKESLIAQAIRLAGNTAEADDEIQEIARQASVAFKDVQAEARRAMRSVYRYYHKNRTVDHKMIAAAMIAVGYTDKSGHWVQDEADAKGFAKQVLPEEFAYFMFSCMKKADQKVATQIREELFLRASFGLEEGQVLSFVDGEAELVDEDGEQLAFAVARDRSLFGNWLVKKDERGFYLSKDPEEALFEAIPHEDNDIRVFITRDVPGASEALQQALIESDTLEISLVDCANYGTNLKESNVVVLGGKAISYYRYPYGSEALKGIINGIQGIIKDVYSYGQSRVNATSVVVLRKIRPLTKRFPQNIDVLSLRAMRKHHHTTETVKL